MIGIVIPPDVRAKAGIPPGAALGLVSSRPMAFSPQWRMVVCELGDENSRRWSIADVGYQEMNAWIEAAK